VPENLQTIIYVIARNEAIANYVWRTYTVRDCHAIARNDMVVVMLKANT